MSPSTAIPAEPGTTPAPAAAGGDAPAGHAPRTGMTELVAARLAAKVAAPNDGAPSVEEPAGPRLAPGKPVPGPAAWRALERHAANFRLR